MTSKTLKFERALLISLVVSAMTVPATAAPVLKFGRSSLVISSIEPGGRVAILAVVHEPKEYQPRVRVLGESLQDSDRDGVITFDVKTGVTDVSIWVVADESSGEVLVMSPLGAVPVKVIPGSALRSPEALAFDGDYLEILYFRPKVGAWRLSVVDSGSKDTDRKPDGSASIRFGDFSPLGAAPPTPGHYRPGDVAVAIDPIELVVARLGGAR